MATRPGNGRQAIREHGNRLAMATLVFGILGLIIGVLGLPALLLGLVAVVLGVGNLTRGRERLSPAGRGMTALRRVVVGRGSRSSAGQSWSRSHAPPSRSKCWPSSRGRVKPARWLSI